MNLFTQNANYKLYFVLMLLFAFAGCQSKQYNHQVNDLVREGNLLIEQDALIISEWKAESSKTFTPENRAKFPSNREALRPSAENQIRLLEQREDLLNSAAGKFEQASQISTNEKERKVTSLFAASFRKDAEVSQIFKEQANLILDNNINDLQSFEAKFKELIQKAEMKIKERDEMQAEAKRIVGR
jgi:vacuolar-type H+-ATPase subunit I/STV1